MNNCGPSWLCCIGKYLCERFAMLRNYFVDKKIMLLLQKEAIFDT
jgi:hypothetical protein